ncbi:MAG: hypothetical protein RR365_00910 [Bacteroides sp.]
MQLGNYNVALYVEFLAKFSKGNIDESLEPKILNYLNCNLKVDVIIRDIIEICKKRFENGESLASLLTILENEFISLNLNSRANFQEYKYFFEGYITSSFRTQILSGFPSVTKEASLEAIKDLISHFLLLGDSCYKVSMGLSILHFALWTQSVNELSAQLLGITDYLNTYDLQDMVIQETLFNIFTLG